VARLRRPLSCPTRLAWWVERFPTMVPVASPEAGLIAVIRSRLAACACASHLRCRPIGERGRREFGSVGRPEGIRQFWAPRGHSQCRPDRRAFGRVGRPQVRSPGGCNARRTVGTRHTGQYPRKDLIPGNMDGRVSHRDDEAMLGVRAQGFRLGGKWAADDRRLAALQANAGRATGSEVQRAAPACSARSGCASLGMA